MGIVLTRDRYQPSWGAIVPNVHSSTTMLRTDHMHAWCAQAMEAILGHHGRNPDAAAKPRAHDSGLRPARGARAKLTVIQ